MKATTAILIVGAGVATYVVARRLTAPAAPPKGPTAGETALGLAAALADIVKNVTAPAPSGDKGTGATGVPGANSTGTKRAMTSSRGPTAVRPTTSLGVLDLDEPSYSTVNRKTGGGGALVFGN